MRVKAGLTHLPVPWAASPGTTEQERGLQTQREGEPLELSLNVQSELDSRVRWSKDQREEMRAGRTRSQAVWVRETQGVREGSPWWGWLRMVSSAEAMQRAKEHPEQTPKRSGSRSSCEWAYHFRWRWFMSQNRNDLLVDNEHNRLSPDRPQGF